ncbi:asparagine synthase-related protein [Derxia lacustris]|uniref:asparagine synthase-related protein n=1 Tax=Derxia lacustris TaxID=764842 RepID=UPI00111C0C5F|nr:asparagine synthetase B family protein [Derxia lacustris]
MTHFVVVSDPDPARRRAFADAVRPRLAPLPWMTAGEREHGDSLLLWAAAPTAPVDFALGADGRLAVVFGQLQGEDAPLAAPAAACLAAPVERLTGRNGFYAALLLGAHGEIDAGADTLGLFPVYWLARGEVAIVASSLMPFGLHPLGSRQFDPIGVANSLLTVHGRGGRSTLDGVRRLMSGGLLSRRAGRTPVETEPGWLLPSDRHFGRSERECVDLFDDCLGRIAGRMARSGPIVLSLSGGLDSRLVGGYLQRAGADLRGAITLGDAGDYEMGCARPVARALGIPHRPVPVDFDAFPALARMQVGLEHVDTSIPDLSWWNALPAVEALGARIATGLLGDAVMADDTYEPGVTDRCDFAARFGYMNRWGLPAPAVAQLLAPVGGQAVVDAALDEMRDAWARVPGEWFQRIWLWELRHRERGHVGAVAWRMSLGALPLLPFVDRDLLELVAGMPHAPLYRRQAQRELLRTRFDKLARLPLDRNSAHTAPLVENLLGKVRRKLDPARLLRRLRPAAEHRYYARVYDFNNTGWRAVRACADAARGATGALFDRAALDRLLPAAGAEATVGDKIIDTSGLKTLAALTLLCGMQDDAARAAAEADTGRSAPLPAGRSVEPGRAATVAQAGAELASSARAAVHERGRAGDMAQAVRLVAGLAAATAGLGEAGAALPPQSCAAPLASDVAEAAEPRAPRSSRTKLSVSGDSAHKPTR